ncbi:peroxiredoxin family protein [Amycolatopsis sp. NPDC004625]|uniref:peroxiredoxin family protein n=1 Tax=Amycolatopsis sp. NPDC004625 TaxID=3154670 RepID=UPI0033BC7667
MLEAGSPAPPLVLEDTEGRPVRLAGQATLLYFMRSASCPVCNRHVRELVESAGVLAAADVRVVIAVPEDRPAAAAWRAKHRIPFPVLTGRPHELVGLGRKLFGSMQQSGSVLVDAQGIVRHAHGATLPTGSYDRPGIFAAVARLRTTA